jgi:hypothetical protein
MKKITVFPSEKHISTSVDGTVIIGVPRKNIYEETKERYKGVNKDILERQRDHIESVIDNIEGEDKQELKEMIQPINDILK